MSFAIYEIFGLIISLPLSYAMARIAKNIHLIHTKMKLTDFLQLPGTVIMRMS
jgi:hypothetical protein